MVVVQKAAAVYPRSYYRWARALAQCHMITFFQIFIDMHSLTGLSRAAWDTEEDRTPMIGIFNSMNMYLLDCKNYPKSIVEGKYFTCYTSRGMEGSDRLILIQV